VSTRNASFQQWQSLLTNRNKRHRAGEFLVQGVRPISLAVDHGWEIRDLIYPDRQSLSSWARDILERSNARAVAMEPSLVAELADKESAELIAVVGRLEAGGASLEESLALWERGEALASRCEEWLEGARKRLAAARDQPL